MTEYTEHVICELLAMGDNPEHLTIEGIDVFVMIERMRVLSRLLICYGGRSDHLDIKRTQDK